VVITDTSESFKLFNVLIEYLCICSSPSVYVQSRFGKTPRASLSEEILMGEMNKVNGRSDRLKNAEGGSPITNDVFRGKESPQVKGHQNCET